MKYHFDWKEVSDDVLKEALGILISRGVFTKHQPPFAEPQYQITTDNYVQNGMLYENEFNLALLSSGYGLLNEVIPKLLGKSEIETEEVGVAPASDRVVSLQDNQDQVAELREELSNLKKAIEKDRSNDFEEKEAVTTELDGHINALSKNQIFISTGERITWICLLVGEKFADTIIGQLAAGVVKLVSLLFTSL